MSKKRDGSLDPFISPITGRLSFLDSLRKGYIVVGGRNGAKKSGVLIDHKIDIRWLKMFANLLSKLPLVMTNPKKSVRESFPNAQIMKDIGGTRRLLTISSEGNFELGEPGDDYMMFDENGNVDIQGGRVINSAPPVDGSDLVTKDYADQMSGSQELTALGEVTGYKPALSNEILLKLVTLIDRQNGLQTFINRNTFNPHGKFRLSSELEDMWSEAFLMGAFNSKSTVTSGFMWFHAESDSSGSLSDFSLRKGGFITPGDKVFNYNIQNNIMNYFCPIDMDGNRITNLPIPLNNSDVATKLYVDYIASTIQPQSLTVTGDVQGFKPSYDNQISLTLSNTGVIPGNYTNPTIAVDSSGRITSASNGSSSNPFIQITGDVSGSGLSSAPIQVSFKTNPVFYGLGSLTMPSGTTAQRFPVGIGQIRFNTTIGCVEYSDASSWKSVASREYVGLNTVKNVYSQSPIVALETIVSPIAPSTNEPYKYIDLSLENSGAIPGNYTNPNVSVDTFGRITSITNGSSSSRSIMQGGVLTTYNTNISLTTDHIKFDYVIFSMGSGIILDTSSPYTTASNVDSIGRITLPAGKTFKLTGSICRSPKNVNITANDYNAVRWVNIDTNQFIGVGTCAPVSSATINASAGIGAIAYITTTVPTRVELRITFATFANIASAQSGGAGGTFFLIEEV